MGISFSNSPDLLRDFRIIPPNQHFAIIRFYQQNESDIANMPIREQLIILSYYVDALFAESEMEQLLIQQANWLLELSIVHNIQYVDGQDIYLRTLYQKTIAHLRLSDFDTATKLASQLLRIDTNRPLHQTLLQDCLLLQRPIWVKQLGASGLILVLLGICCSFLNILFIESFYANWYPTTTQIELVFYLLGTFLVIAAFLGHYYFVQRRVQAILKQIRAKKTKD